MNYTVHDLEWIIRRKFSEDEVNQMTNAELLSEISEALGRMLSEVL